MTQEPGTERCDYKDPTIVIRQAIEHLILDLDCETNVLSKPRVRWMTRILTAHVISLIIKFIEGQLEHGDNLEKADLKKELGNEIKDLVWYLAALKNPMKKKL